MGISKSDLRKISDYIWEIPKDFRPDMRVPARIFASQNLLEEIVRDKSLEQLANVAALPGIQKYAIVMPDAHEGYGFPIGGVAATLWPDGVISPGGIGYDINCGVRLLLSKMRFSDIEHYLERLARDLYGEIPSGVGKGGRLKLDIKILDEVLRKGVKWAINEGYGKKEDLNYIESNGALPNADPAAVSDHAKSRGRDQLGTMGAGNHFVEVDRVAKIYDSEIAADFGLYENQIAVLIHTGSRGLGHQVATDYIRVMLNKLPEYGIKLPDRELACLPLSSPEGIKYFNAMSAAANFAWTNRQLITQEVRKVWREIFGDRGGELEILYDVAHNIAKIETHPSTSSGQVQKLIVHRKGATRAFPPGHPDLPEQYRTTGQPVIIPGSMGTASYVMVGTETGMKLTFGTSCHGAGRRMSRHAAKREIRGSELLETLEKRGIRIQAGSLGGLAEEAPIAYKNIEEVVDVVHNAGIARKVAELRPVAVIKG